MSEEAKPPPAPPHGHAHGHHHIGRELREHVPYSIGSVLVAMAALGILGALGVLSDERAENLFHVFHPTHILLSAAATTSMFWMYERRLAKSVAVGVLGAGVICEMSDVLFPFLGGVLLGREMEFHFCVVAHPWIVLPFLAVGIAAGIASTEILSRTSVFSHAGHVIVSSAASLLYLASFGLAAWTDYVGYVLVLLLVSVMVPCCLSDIVFPLLFVRGERRLHGHSHRIAKREEASRS